MNEEPNALDKALERAEKAEAERDRLRDEVADAKADLVLAEKQTAHDEECIIELKEECDRLSAEVATARLCWSEQTESRKEAEAECDRLRELLRFWSHDGRLQTFEDRERFRAAVNDALGAADTGKEALDRMAKNADELGLKY